MFLKQNEHPPVQLLGQNVGNFWYLHIFHCLNKWFYLGYVHFVKMGSVHKAVSLTSFSFYLKAVTIGMGLNLKPAHMSWLHLYFKFLLEVHLTLSSVGLLPALLAGCFRQCLEKQRSIEARTQGSRIQRVCSTLWAISPAWSFILVTI